ncbi:MAG: nicotinamide-nucleotide amidohydrolase family protein [Bacilli bacterium]|nr:nicotinamide-nucleotide amidohydrolase family protein [Bacilli bacterium]
MKKIIEKLTKLNKTISTMESCTGGGIANAITNIEGASEVFKFSAVTYSNEYKIKMGVDKNIIDEYSVYSMETANEMSKNISNFTNANYGVGITGKLNRVDRFNPYGLDNVVYISIYDKDNNKYYNSIVEAKLSTRKDNKELVINEVITLLDNILNIK